jgi:intracellular multiplication protein IcmL
VVEDILDVLKNKKINQQSTPKLMSFFIILLLTNLAIGFLTYVSYLAPREPDYFYTTMNGQFYKLLPLSMPNTSDSVVSQWANLAVIDTFTYDFVNYNASLEKDSQYFTSAGWYTFLRSLTDSSNLSKVISKKLVVSAVAIKPPSILMKGMLNGVYSWRIQLPILVTYQSASEFVQQNLLVTLLVCRIPTLDNPKGLGIEQFVVSTFVDDTNPSQVSQ